MENETKSGEYPLPLSYIVDVNHNCNLKCIMCVKRTMKEQNGQVPVENLLKIVDKLPWTREILIGALGDICMYKDVETAWKYMNNKRINSPITSNATLWTEDFIRKIPKNSQMHVSIEGDGHIAAYDEIESNFETVKKNVELLHKMRPDVRIIINHLLFKTNLEKAREIIYFCKTVNAGITFFFPMFFSKELDEKYNAHKVPDLIEKLVELAKLCVENGVPYSMTNPCVERPCMRALSQPIIAYDGTVYPCDYVYQNIENTKDGSWINWYNGEQHIVPQHQYAMGNIYKDDFIKMWNSEKWKKLRSIVTKLNEEGSGKSFYETLKDVDLDKEFDHCKVCLARWGRCL